MSSIKQRGSNHYKTGTTEPIDLISAGGMMRDFALSNIIKYAFRNRKTARKVINIDDLEKIKHYCDILISEELKKRDKAKIIKKIKTPKDLKEFVPKQGDIVQT